MGSGALVCGAHSASPRPPRCRRVGAAPAVCARRAQRCAAAGVAAGAPRCVCALPRRCPRAEFDCCVDAARRGQRYGEAHTAWPIGGAGAGRSLTGVALGGVERPADVRATAVRWGPQPGLGGPIARVGLGPQSDLGSPMSRIGRMNESFGWANESFGCANEAVRRDIFRGFPTGRGIDSRRDVAGWCRTWRGIMRGVYTGTGTGCGGHTVRLDPAVSRRVKHYGWRGTTNFIHLMNTNKGVPTVCKYRRHAPRALVTRSDQGTHA